MKALCLRGRKAYPDLAPLVFRVNGVTLRSNRYAWPERARVAGHPERFAQEALGHNSKAVHRAYAKNTQVVLPSLESLENKAREQNIVPFPKAQNR